MARLHFVFPSTHSWAVSAFAIVNNAAVNICVQVLSSCFQFFGAYCQGVEFLGHIVTLQLFDQTLPLSKKELVKMTL